VGSGFSKTVELFGLPPIAQAHPKR
jgi:hypothetical protein